MEGGRVRYAGCPEIEDLVPRLKKAPKPEDKAATEHEDKTIRFGGDDSDRNSGAEEDDRERAPLAEWTHRSSPERYLDLYPDGPNAELARAVIEAEADGADEGE